MKLLVFAAYYKPHVGGYEKDIAEWRERLQGKGYEIDIVTCNSNNLCSIECDMATRSVIYRLPYFDLINKSYPMVKICGETIRLLKYIWRKHYDCVITQTRFFSTSLIGYLFAQIKSVPLIHVERGAYHNVIPNVVIYKLAELYDHIIATMIVKKAVVNVGVSDAACKFIEHIGGKNTKTIYNGIVIPKTAKQERHNGFKNITFVGRLIYGKGVQDLITAFNNLRKNYKVMLNIAGSGNYKNELIKMARYDPCIKFLGECNRQQVDELLANTDIFVNPSYSEALPSTVLEAGVMKVPIVATDVGGTNEVINKMWLVQPHRHDQIEQAIEMLLDHKKVAEMNAQIVYDTVRRKFDWDDITNQWDKLLKVVNRK